MDIEDVLAEFDAKKGALTTFCEKTRGLVEEILLDEKIQVQSVQARVKGRDKLKEKYLDSKKEYKCLDDITDQAALRVITYYEDEVDLVAQIVKREFEVDLAQSVDKRETEPDKFGYYALNLICKYSKARTSHPEYKRFNDLICEIQVTSVLRHAWSEIEHPWYDLKGAFPDNIKRRFARMAALLEIAESEFTSLKKLQSDYRLSVSLQVGAKFRDVKVDAVSMRSFVEQEPLVGELDKLVAWAQRRKFAESTPDYIFELRSKTSKAAGLNTLQEIFDALMKYRPAIHEYTKRINRELHSKNVAALPVQKGVCIYYVCVLLVSLRGIGPAEEFFKNSGDSPPWDIEKGVAIAREIEEKHFG